MHCYEIGETVGGLLVNREDREPYIPTPHGCPLILSLSQEMHRLFQEAPKNWCYLERAAVSFQKEKLVLAPEDLFSANRVSQALVRVSAAPGVSGHVHLTAASYGEAEQRGRVVRQYHPFPSAGVTPLCSADVVHEAQEGAEMLDLLVLLNPGAQLRIERDGQLEGACPEIYVQWTGKRLNAYGRGAVGALAE